MKHQTPEYKRACALVMARIVKYRAIQWSINRQRPYVFTPDMGRLIVDLAIILDVDPVQMRDDCGVLDAEITVNWIRGAVEATQRGR